MPTEPIEQAGLVELRLYVSNQSRKCARAHANLRRICEQHLRGRCRIDVIDILERPEVAKREQIVAIPTVVRRRPLPMRTVIGDLSNTEKTLDGVDLQATNQGVDL